MLTDCPILYRDDQVILVNKPAGMLSHPNPGAVSARNRGAFLGPYDFQGKTFLTEDGPVWLLHRLDQDTSGVLMAALDLSSAEKLRKDFEAGSIAKQYLALVRGDPGPKGTWKDHLSVKRDGTKVRSFVLRGYEPNAELRFRRINYSASTKLSLLEIELITGRTHQIRVQANSRQHPLFGDDIYGDFSWNRKMLRELGCSRLFLHAHQIEFNHPKSGKKISVVAPLPTDLQEIVERLKSTQKQ
ncbi:MAG: RluA family pseudouridine synthase [Bdellovibrionales bacterium]|nr:RluA family pseudouridine synthase [Bdellovibrionales bacterium]